jgi:hypothetical protein
MCWIPERVGLAGYSSMNVLSSFHSTDNYNAQQRGGIRKIERRNNLDPTSKSFQLGNARRNTYTPALMV